MKVKELRDYTDAELEAKILELKQELLNLRFQSKQLENPKRIFNVKKDIARVMTILAQRKFEVVSEEA